MMSEQIPERAANAVPHAVEPLLNLFSATDVAEILQERDWLAGECSPEQAAWCEKAAAMLGPHAADRAALGDFLSLIFHYDAAALMSELDTHITMSRYAARDALRHLGRLVLEKSPIDSERFKEIINVMKENLDIRGREMFQPLRLALAGRTGGGHLDRVVLLIDGAAAAGFAGKVKTVRERALEFCAAFD